MADFLQPPTYAEVVLFDKDGKKPRFNPIWLDWFLRLTQFINDSGGGGGVAHNDTTGLQGGTANQYYHVTSAQNTLIVNILVGGLRPTTDAGAAQTVTKLSAGNGAPNNANGANGDFYFRGDGTVAGSTVIYHKQAGAWVALTTT